MITSPKYHRNPFSICMTRKKRRCWHVTSGQTLGHSEKIIASATHGLQRNKNGICNDSKIHILDLLNSNLHLYYQHYTAEWYNEPTINSKSSEFSVSFHFFGLVFRWDQRLNRLNFGLSPELRLTNCHSASSLTSSMILLYFIVYFWISEKMKQFSLIKTQSLTD